MKKSTCRHCLAPIEQGKDGVWRDELPEPDTCYRALNYKHSPVIEGISDRFGMEGRYDR